MPDRYVETHIRPIPMFQQLRPAELDYVLRAFQVLRFGAGETVVVEGNETQGLFVITEGEGVLLQRGPNGEQQRTGELQAGAVLDRGALFASRTETATLRMTRPSTVLFLSRKRMQTVLSRYPQVREQLGRSDVGTTAQPKRKLNPYDLRADHNIGSIQRADEEVLLVRRRHPWVFIRRGWWSLMILVMFSVAAFYLTALGLTLALLTAGSGFVLAAMAMTYFYLEWRNDSIVVTDSRVIRIERVIPTFSVNINEIPLDRVQEVNTELPQGDIFARIFQYGDLELKNASDAGDMILDAIPNPDEVQDIIFNRRSQWAEDHDENRRNAIRADIEKYLGLGEDDKVSKSDAMPNEASVPQSPVVSNFWTSLSPARMRYTNVDGDVVYRKHVTVWMRNVIAPFTVIVGAVVVFVVSTISNIGLIGFPTAALLFVFGALWFWWSDWDWRNDLYIVGNDRVTLIHRRPLWLQNEVDQVLLNRIDNVVSETEGIIDAMFQRGNVRISLVGEGLDRAKIFHNVHRPHDIQAELSRRQAHTKVEQQQQEQNAQEQAIKEYLSVYHDTVNQGQQPPGTLDETAQQNSAASPDRVQPYRAKDQQRPPNVPRRNH